MDGYLVVDASVSLKWSLDDEEAVAQAAALLDDVIATDKELAAPSLWVYEVANGLVTAVRRGRITPAQGSEALSHLLAVNPRLADAPIERVYALAQQYRLTAYDAAYLALAEALNAPLWTGDRPFYDKVQTSMRFVHWVGDFGGRSPS